MNCWLILRNQRALVGSALYQASWTGFSQQKNILWSIQSYSTLWAMKNEQELDRYTSLVKFLINVILQQTARLYI